MSAKTIQFNSFDLQDSNFRTKDIIYRNVPTRVIDLEPYSRRDGFRFVNSYYESKDITVKGTLTRDTAANLKISLDSMKESLNAEEANLDIDDGGTTIRYVCTVSSFDVPEEFYHISQIPYSINFKCQPFGKQTTSTTQTKSIIASISDSYSETNISGATGISSTLTYKKIGQSFVGNGNELDSVKLFLDKIGSPTGDLIVSVYAHSGTFGTSSVPTGSALASVTVDASTVTSGSNTFDFTGANRITLSNGVYYCVVIDAISVGDNSNYIQVSTDGTSPTHSGNISVYTTSWIASPATDLCFYVYTLEDPYVDTIDPTGSYGPNPVITWTLNGAPSEAITQIAFTNSTTGDVITIGNLTLDASGDYIEVDTENMTVTASYDGGAGTEIDYTGVFPTFVAGNNSYSLTLTGGGATFTVVQTITYYPTYL